MVKRTFMRPYAGGVSMRRIVSLCVILSGLWSPGQEIPVGEWRSHMSYGQAKILEHTGSRLFCAVENGLFSLDLETGSFSRHTKEAGFSDVNVSSMDFNTSAEMLLIGYSSGLLDVLSSNGDISTIRTLFEAPIVANKAIKNMVSNEDRAYLATDFGVIELDLQNLALRDNFRNIGPEGQEVQVKEMLLKTDSLYIITNEGIQAGSLNDNLLDFNQWTFFEETSAGFDNLVEWEGTIYSLNNGTDLWRFNGSEWISTGISGSGESVGLLAEESGLLVVTNTSIERLLPDQLVLVTDPFMVSARDLVVIDDEFWVADAENGLLRTNGSSTEQLVPAGPLNDFPTRMKFAVGKIFFLFGPSPSDFTGGSDNLGYSVFEAGIWSNETIEGFSNLSDVSSIGDNLYFTSIGGGIFDAQKGLILDETNSDLVVSTSSGEVELTAIDEHDGSLWIAAYDSDTPVYHLTIDGILRSYTSSQVGSSYLLDIDIAANGQLWMRRGPSPSGIAIYGPLDGQSRTMTSADGLPSSVVNGLDIGASDRAWMATSAGPGSYSGASFPFNDFGVTQPIFENSRLLENENLNDVILDGGDRVWMASDQGVYVFDNTATELVHRFTAENSPLPSDTVFSMSYNPESGEVFFSTTRGVASYRSASSFAETYHAETIDVFPNPVPPGYSGMVGIKGLARNATLKITDSQGRLVRQIQASGGSAGWDLRNHRGSLVATGVYLIFSSSEDGEETHVGKVAVIR